MASLDGDSDRDDSVTIAQRHAEEPDLTEAVGREGGSETQQEVNKPQFVIVVAGRTRNGKSNSLNNILRVKNFLSKAAAKSITREINCTRVARNGQELIVIDTPGLGSTDIPLKAIRRNFEALVGGLNYTLLLCHSVGPNNMVLETDGVIFKNLQRMCGSDVWRKCVVFFTFSDSLLQRHVEEGGDHKSYLEILREHAEVLSKMLRKVCGASVPKVKLILDVNVESEHIEEIVAVPMGLAYDDKMELLPDARHGKDWRDRAYVEILRRATPLDRKALVTVTHGAAVSGILMAAGVGALVGGFTVGMMGLLVGGVTAIPAATIGAVAGGVVGAVGAVGSEEVVISGIKKAREERAKKLSEIKFHDISLSEEHHQVQPEQHSQVQPEQHNQVQPEQHNQVQPEQRIQVQPKQCTLSSLARAARTNSI